MMAKKNGRAREFRAHIDENSKPGAEVVPLHGKSNMENVTTFGKLKPGDMFRFVKTEISPEGECPPYTKVALKLRNESDKNSGLHNCVCQGTTWKGWMSDITPVEIII